MKKFYSVIIILSVFLMACKENSMQKLIFVNANDVSVDLTSDPYGVIEWEGFSNVDFELQTQQVPFRDGSVYLDGLLSERDLSVTLAMNDNKNLTRRYELRRNLIEILNPKLGEGYLIYTNDYISKRIKCVPQIPLFPTHNSNEPGTPKASLSWTACDPYWEDVEETEVVFSIGEKLVINNSGDLSIPMKIDMIGNATNPEIKNLNTGKKIKWENTIDVGLLINTVMGQKKIKNEDFAENILDGTIITRSVIYCADKDLFIAVGYSCVITSVDGYVWNNYPIDNISVSLNSIAYSSELGLFVAVGDGGVILISSDVVNWTQVTLDATEDLNGVRYISSFNKFYVLGDDGLMLRSSDGINWDVDTNIATSVNLYSIAEKDGTLVVVGHNGLFCSLNGGDWQFVSGNMQLYDVSLLGNYFIAVGSRIIFSNNGIDWEYVSYLTNSMIYSIVSIEPSVFIAVSDEGIYKCTWSNFELVTEEMAITNGCVCYANERNLIVAVTNAGNAVSYNADDWDVYSTIGFYGLSVSHSVEKKITVSVGQGILVSTDDENWRKIDFSSTLFSVIYCAEKGLFVTVGSSGKILTSPDGINWTQRTSGVNFTLKCVTYSSELDLFVAVGYHVLTSSDGINWTQRTSGNAISGVTVAYSNFAHTFVILRNNEVSFTSPDGINWTQRTVPMASSYKLIYSLKFKKFIAVGTSGIYNSVDGVNWYQRKSGNFLSVAYSNEYGVFLAFDIDGVANISYDSLYWITTNKVSMRHIQDIIYDAHNNQFVMVGYPSHLFGFQLMDVDSQIQYLSADSDMSFELVRGKNELILLRESGTLFVKITYRQKYIGV